jgi:hypothetical protein
MLNSVLRALAKIINIEILTWNMCIQCLKNVKSSFITINLSFISIFGMYVNQVFSACNCKYWFLEFYGIQIDDKFSLRVLTLLYMFTLVQIHVLLIKTRIGTTPIYALLFLLDGLV